MHKFFLVLIILSTPGLVISLEAKKTMPAASLSTSSEKLKKKLGFTAEKTDKNLVQKIHEDTQKNIQKLKRVDYGDTKKPGQPGYFPSETYFSKFWTKINLNQYKICCLSIVFFYIKSDRQKSL